MRVFPLTNRIESYIPSKDTEVFNSTLSTIYISFQFIFEIGTKMVQTNSESGPMMEYRMKKKAVNKKKLIKRRRKKGILIEL